MHSAECHSGFYKVFHFMSNRCSEVKGSLLKTSQFSSTEAVR